MYMVESIYDNISNQHIRESNAVLNYLNISFLDKRIGWDGQCNDVVSADRNYLYTGTWSVSVADIGYDLVKDKRLMNP